MVEINNQRKAFLDMLAWSEGTDNGRQKTRNHGDRSVYCEGGELLQLLRMPRKAMRWPQNSNQQAPDATSFFPVGGMPTASSGADFSRKVRTLWHCSRWRRRRHLWLLVISVRQSTVATISGLLLPGAGYGQFERVRLTAWLQNSKEAGGTVREIDVWASHRDYLRSGYLHHRLPVMGC